MASSGIVVKNKSSSSALNHLDLVDVPLGVRVPGRCSNFKIFSGENDPSTVESQNVLVVK